MAIRMENKQATTRAPWKSKFSIFALLGGLLVALAVAASTVSWFVAPAADRPDQVFLINADGTALDQITDISGRTFTMPAWSPDGRFIVMSGGTNRPEDGRNLWIFEVATRQATQLTFTD